MDDFKKLLTVAVLYATKKSPEEVSDSIDAADYDYIVKKLRFLNADIHYNTNTIMSDFLSSDDIVKNGMVFTPFDLSKFVVDRCSKHVKINRHSRIGDYSCGFGSFIFALNETYPDTPTLSFENNEKICELMNVILDESNTVIKADTLFDTNQYNNSFDMLVGNPPYVRMQNLERGVKDKLMNSEEYRDYLTGSFDLSVPFIRKAISLLKEGGVAGLILSRKIFQSKYGKPICECLLRETNILEIIDFADNQLFDDKTTYTSVIIFQKTTSETNKKFIYTKVPTFERFDNDEINKIIESNSIEISKDSLHNDFPWRFQTEKEKMILHYLNKKGVPLIDVFDIVQGFRTGNNKLFLCEGFCEPAIRQYVDGRNIKRGYISSSKNIIFPYRQKNRKVVILTEEEFNRTSPFSYALIKSRIKDSSNDDWFSYKRSQNMWAMFEKKLLIKEMMPRAEIAADIEGTVCFSSGYALVPKTRIDDRTIFNWSLILSSSLMEFQYRLLGTNLHSGWFRMYKEHMNSIVLPDTSVINNPSVLTVCAELGKDLENEGLWNQLDDALFDAFGIKKDLKAFILNTLKDSHSQSIPTVKKQDTKVSVSFNDNQSDCLEESVYPELDTFERKRYYPIELTKYNRFHQDADEYRSLVTFQKDKNLPIQRWYKYTQGFSCELVDRLIDEMEVKTGELLFDPFCGCGTTLLAANRRNIDAIGCDVSPLSCWIATVKTFNWTEENISNIEHAIEQLMPGENYDFKDLLFRNYFEKAFHPEILAQTLHIKKWISSLTITEMEKNFLFLGLIAIQEEISLIRKHGSHYRFLNDDSHIGVNKLNISLASRDTDIVSIFKKRIEDMIGDIKNEHERSAGSKIICSDIKRVDNINVKADAVITSPPYLNRNNYFSQQKAELSLLGLIESKADYGDLVKQSLCSHVEADLPSSPICVVEEVNTIINEVMKEKSNNAKIPHMIAGYFNDIDSFFSSLSKFIKKGGKIAMVLGNCRWNGVVIPVDHLICLIAEKYGFSVEKILVARLKGNSPQQMKKYGRVPVRESIVILSYNK